MLKQGLYEQLINRMIGGEIKKAEEENMYVLVELGNNDYRKQKIETGLTEDGKTVVLSGLNVGDEIVVTGAFYLLDAR